MLFFRLFQASHTFFVCIKYSAEVVRRQIDEQLSLWKKETARTFEPSPCPLKSHLPAAVMFPIRGEHPMIVTRAKHPEFMMMGKNPVCLMKGNHLLFAWRLAAVSMNHWVHPRSQTCFFERKHRMVSRVRTESR